MNKIISNKQSEKIKCSSCDLFQPFSSKIYTDKNDIFSFINYVIREEDSLSMGGLFLKILRSSKSFSPQYNLMKEYEHDPELFQKNKQKIVVYIVNILQIHNRFAVSDLIDGLFKIYSVKQFLQIKIDDNNALQFLSKKFPDEVDKAMKSITTGVVLKSIETFSKQAMYKLQWDFLTLNRSDLRRNIKWREITCTVQKHITEALRNYKRPLNKEKRDDLTPNKKYFVKENTFRNSECVQKLFFLNFKAIAHWILKPDAPGLKPDTPKIITCERWRILSCGGAYAFSDFEGGCIQTILNNLNIPSSIVDVEKEADIEFLRRREVDKQICNDTLKVLTGDAMSETLFNRFEHLDMVLLINPPINQYRTTVKQRNKKWVFQCSEPFYPGQISLAAFQPTRAYDINIEVIEMLSWRNYIRNTFKYIEEKNKNKICVVSTVYFRREAKSFKQAVKNIFKEQENKYLVKIFDLTVEPVDFISYGWYCDYTYYYTRYGKRDGIKICDELKKAPEVISTIYKNWLILAIEESEDSSYKEYKHTIRVDME